LPLNIVGHVETWIYKNFCSSIEFMRRHRVTASQLDLLLQYLPIFDTNQSPAIIEIVDGQVIHHDNQPDWSGFWLDFKESGLPMPFDWQNWQVSLTPETIAKAGLPKLIKALTRYFHESQTQADEDEDVGDETIVPILRRLQQIRQTMTREDVVLITYQA
ncbi:hypothetical protein QUF58_14460, partial [Anaerolineales bacterium HSG24]|nr:hypothetical protein [Anaerolineales bacterium HSG24]